MEVISINEVRERNLTRTFAAIRTQDKKCFCCPKEFEGKCFGPLDGTWTVVVAEGISATEIKNVCKLNRKDKK